MDGRLPDQKAKLDLFTEKDENDENDEDNKVWQIIGKAEEIHNKIKETLEKADFFNESLSDD